MIIITDKLWSAIYNYRSAFIIIKLPIFKAIIMHIYKSLIFWRPAPSSSDYNIADGGSMVIPMLYKYKMCEPSSSVQFIGTSEFILYQLLIHTTTTTTTNINI